MAAILAFLAALIPAAVKAWFAGRASPLQTESEKVGSAQQQVADLKVQAQVAQKVATAEADAPNTVAGVVDRMKDGSF